MAVGGDDAVDAGVEDEDVGVGSGLDHALAGIEAEDSGRVLRPKQGGVGTDLPLTRGSGRRCPLRRIPWLHVLV